jgi:hypothetical protein
MNEALKVSHSSNATILLNAGLEQLYENCFGEYLNLNTKVNE